METALKELGINKVGTYSTSGAYTLDIDSDEEEEPNNDLKETHTKDSVSEIM